MDVVERERFNDREGFSHRTKSTEVGPFEPHVEQPPPGPYPREHDPTSHLVAGLLELRRRDPGLAGGGIEVGNPGEQPVNVVGLAGELGHEQAGIEEVLMAERGLLGET